VVLVRARTEADLDECEELARVVHERDGYPVFLPGDVRAFLSTRAAIAAFVAELSGRVVGHVALHSGAPGGVVAIASRATGLGPAELGVVARLLVSPESRGRGVGRSLLKAAATHAVSRGLRPMLDVHSTLERAVGLYESCGWVRVGAVTVHFRAGSIDEFVYVAPQGLYPQAP
jgi:GNAT superfamily N-acetyltransferase